MPPIDNGNYKVGRGKPPRHSQFRKGQSGNPKGRPPRSNSFDAILAKVLDQSVAATIKGKRRHVTMLEAILRRLANRAVEPDLRSIDMLLKYLSRSDGPSTSFPVGADGKPMIPIRVIRDILDFANDDDD